jgi:hypothetical protein
MSTRRSKAKQTHDRTTKAPTSRRPTPKPKKGHRVMEAQLAKQPAPTTLIEHDDPPEAPVSLVKQDPDYPTPPKDPWWVAEREDCYQLTLAGTPQNAIAAKLGRDRHTIGRWVEDNRFIDRLQQENEGRFASMRQRRVMQTTRLTDKAYGLAEKMLKLTDENPKDLNSRLAARDWLSEFREQSRREDEIFGLDKQRVDVNIHGVVQHKHKGTVDLSFKEFLTGSLKRMGVDIENEAIDAGRADDALVAITEKALLEGSFLEEMVEREKEEQLALSMKSTG